MATKNQEANTKHSSQSSKQSRGSNSNSGNPRAMGSKKDQQTGKTAGKNSQKTSNMKDDEMDES